MAVDNKNLMIGRAAPQKAPAPAESLAGLIPLLPLWAGFGLTLTHTLPSITLPWWVIACAGLLLSGLFLFLLGTRLRRWIVPAGVLVTAALFLILSGSLLDGTRALLNDITTALTGVNGRIYLEYGVSGGTSAAVLLYTLLFSLLFAAAASRGSLLPLVPAAGLIICGIAVGIASPGADTALFALGVLLIPGSGGVSGARRALCRTAAALLCCAIAAAGIFPLRGTETGNLTAGFRERMHALQYDSATNSMPEGKLADLGPWRKSDAEALTVTMDEPQPIYLKGKIFETYTGTSWEELPGSQLAAGEDLFYWLHRNGFYGQSQLAYVYELTGRGESRRVGVSNISACKENAYLPYAFASPGQLDGRRIGDTKTDPGTVSFSVYPGELSDWYELQPSLSGIQDSEQAAEYLRLEQSYYGYVTENDLQLTPESWNVLHRQLGEIEGAYSLRQIQSLIREYLETHMYYNEELSSASGNGDFLHYVFEKSGGGYSVHYATAATLMLRYFGVPARYVEGYYLPQEQAAAASAGEPIVLTENNAHAWAELYLKGVGFVPFEVTPGYVNEEEPVSGGTRTEDPAESVLYEIAATVYPEPETPGIEAPEYGQRNRFVFRPVYLLWIIPLAALVFAAMVISRRLRLRKKLKTIDTADNRSSVEQRYGYAMALKERAGEIPVEGDPDAARINELARFSLHEITGDDRRYMEEYTQRVLDTCKGRWSLWQKLRLRLIEGIY